MPKNNFKYKTLARIYCQNISKHSVNQTSEKERLDESFLSIFHN